jgi:hypothetical protein
MEDIKKYLNETARLDPRSKELLLSRLAKHPDIQAEFQNVIQTGAIPENGIASGEWTAQKISKQLPHLKTHIVYEFLIGLRDEPKRYNRYINRGAKYL